MNRARIEDRLRCHFGAAQTALSAALSEVNACYTYPAFLDGVLDELGHDLPAEDALVQWATMRGEQWLF